MDFVDIVNLVSALAGGIPHIFPEVTYFINAAVRSPVDFQDIEADPAGNFFAGGAFVAGVGCRSLSTVQCLS
jgi:hypothetical protein